MSDNTILERNLLALSSRNASLSRKIGEAHSSDILKFVKSQTGLPVPIILKDGKEYFLHSRFDPGKEGERFFQVHSSGGYLVFLGFGAGYHIFPFLKRKDVSNILIIDRDVSLFKTLFSVKDLREILLDPRVHLMVDAEPKQITEYFLSSYFPAITGDLKTLPLQSRLKTEKLYFTRVIALIKELISTLADDYTVQSHFGKKWYRNTLFNLKAAGSSTSTLKPVRKALIAGAGPSLEVQIEELRNLRKGGTLISTDTALPALSAFGIIPDMVISIDCQHITYHHFMGDYPPDVPLILDLASPANLTRISSKLIFFSSGHPLSQYVSNNWRRFPYIDTSGGNVTHSAVSLANLLGAEEIYLFGTDFSYPEGKSYARSTYIYPLFSSREVRTTPLESQFFSFLLRNNNIEKEFTEDFIRYTTKPMISYKRRLEKAFENSPCKIISVPGKGLPVSAIYRKVNNKKERKIYTMIAAGKPLTDWRDFLNSYEKELTSLPKPTEPFVKYFSQLEPHRKDVWLTLLPAAAAFRREIGSVKPGVELLKMVHSWSRETLRCCREAWL